jgi:hypothetical protein
MDKEQGDKKSRIRFVSSKSLVRDDLFDVAMPVVGVVKNRYERKVTEEYDDDSNSEISFDINSDKFTMLKDQNKFWHPVPKLMLLNGFRTRNVSFRQFFCILESFFLNNLEVVSTVAKDLSSKNSYEFRRLCIDLQVLAEWLQPAPKMYNLLVNDVCIYYGEKKSSPLPSITFDEDTLSYPFWTELEVTHGVFILNVINSNELSLQQLFLEDLKLSSEWDYPLDYSKDKEERIFSGEMTRELLKMVFSFYDFYDRMSYVFPSES